MLEDKNLIELKFPFGKNNVAHETEVPDGSARELLNVDITNSGKPLRRKGYTEVYSGTSIHSLFSTESLTVFCEGSNLNLLNSNFTSTVLATGFTLDAYCSYAEVNKQIYYSNGTQKGVILEDGTHNEWGVSYPGGQPALTTTSGSLEAGKYQVAVTYVSSSGEESGTGRAAVIDLPAGGGIQLNNFASSEAAYMNIYVSSANGDMLYYYTQVAVGTNMWVIQQEPNYGRTLETQFLDRIPSGHIVRYYKGRMWVAKDNLLIFSPSMRYGLYDPRHTYFMFPEDITIVQPVNDGIYVVADKTYFLSGNNPDEMEQVIVYQHKGILNTGMSIPPHMFKDDNDLISDAFSNKTLDSVAYWYSTTGAMLGFPGGRCRAITEDRLSIPEYGRGATLMRDEDGIRQLVTPLTNRGRGSSFGTSDVAVAEVRRNGVLLT